MMPIVELEDGTGDSIKVLDVDGYYVPSVETFMAGHENEARSIPGWRGREDDVIICAYPKTGCRYVDMSTVGGESSWCVNLLKGLVLKDRDVEQTILQSITKMVWLKFTCPRLHNACDCCCEHNSFKYMRHGQVIDMAMFEKICKSIENGHCPHIRRKPDPNNQVQSENSDRRQWYLAPRFSLREGQCDPQLPQCYEREIDVHDVTVSDVSILEVAAAVGNHSIVLHLLLPAGQMYGRHHGLHPIHIRSWEIAARQKQTDVLQLLLSNDEPFGTYVHDTSFIGYHLGDLMYLVAHGCTDGLILLLCICGNVESRPFLEQLVVSAVLYNNPAILGVLSDYFTINSSILLSGDFYISTWQLATLLGYHGCAYEIEKHSAENPELILDLDHESLENVIMWVLNIHVGDKPYIYRLHSHMVAETLKCLSVTSIPTGMAVSEELWIQVLRRRDAEVVSVMLEIIGCDVDTQIGGRYPCRLWVLGLISDQYPSVFSILCAALFINAWCVTVGMHFKSARQTLKTILNSNPSTHLHVSDVINTARELDVKRLEWVSSIDYYDLETRQLMKALPTDELALAALITDPRFNEMKFFVPLLFQHGFAIHTSIVEAMSSDHPLLRLLYQSIVSTPRTLKSRARIVLRQAYPGRRIHDFVNQTGLPVVIKEYIFMTEELNRFCPS